MYTSCPNCQTVFRVKPVDLGRARGKVRCGHCQTTFDALPRLSEAPPTPRLKPASSVRAPSTPVVPDKAREAERPRDIPVADTPQSGTEDWTSSTWRRRQLSISGAAMGTSWPLLGDVDAEQEPPPKARVDEPRWTREDNLDEPPDSGDADPLLELELTLDSVLAGQQDPSLPVADSAESFSESLERLIAESEMEREPASDFPNQESESEPVEDETLSPPQQDARAPTAEPGQGNDMPAAAKDTSRAAAFTESAPASAHAGTSMMAWDLSEDQDWEQIELSGDDDAENESETPLPEPEPQADDPERSLDPAVDREPGQPGEQDKGEKSAGEMAVEIWDELFFDDDHGIPDGGTPVSRAKPSVTFTDSVSAVDVQASPQRDALATEPGWPAAVPTDDRAEDTSNHETGDDLQASAAEDKLPPRETWFDPATTLAGEDFAGVALPTREELPEPGHEDGDKAPEAYEVSAAQLSPAGLVKPDAEPAEEPEPGQQQEFEVQDADSPVSDSPQESFSEYEDFLQEDVPEGLQAAEDDTQAPEEQDLISPFEAGLELVTSGSWEQLPGHMALHDGESAPEDEKLSLQSPHDRKQPDQEPEMSQADMELMEAIAKLEAEGDTGFDEQPDAEPASERAKTKRSTEKSARSDSSAIRSVQAELEALARLFESGASRERDKRSDTEEPSPAESPENFSRLLGKRPSPISRALTGLACVLLAATLAAQAVHYNRQALLKSSRWGPRLEAVYAALGKPVAQSWELDRYDVRQLGGLQDPERPDTLIIGISVRNRASRSQPFPIIRLVLEDRWGQRVGKRDIVPGEYLPANVDASRLMQAGELLRTDVAIVDPPGSGATNFQIDACLAQADGRLSCANLL